MSGRLSYAGIPYNELQQGTKTAPNPDKLQVDVHLATMQLELTAPTGTRLSLQLPAGRLTTTTIESTRTDSNIGDAELRVQQTLPWLRRPIIELGLGLALPTGPYVAKSGAANLPPEASFLTLGRGVSWGIVEAQVSHRLSDKVSSYLQLSARKPLGRTEDDFAWGNEARAVVGAQVALPAGFAALGIAELQWRGGASEPDPFLGGRVETSNAGGTWWTLTPALSYAVSNKISLLAGLRVPVHTNAHGNQLVPSIGGFMALSLRWPISKPKAAAVAKTAPSEAAAAPEPVLGKVTIIDYWATWCAPCKVIDKKLQEAEAGWSNVEIIRIDASGWPDSGVTLPVGSKGLPIVEIYGIDGTRLHLLEGPKALEVVDIVNQLPGTPATTQTHPSPATPETSAL